MNKNQKHMLVSIAASGVLFLLALFLPLEGIARAAVFAAAYLTVGFPVLKKAGVGLIHGQWMDENFLMAIASLGAFCLGEYAEGVAVMLFSRAGELFESYAVGKSRDSISALMQLCPDTACVFRGGEWQTVSPEEVSVGETIRVLPGERVPLDGVVSEGHGTLDTKALTGEPAPREVSAGDGVYSGCVNLSGMLELKVTKEFGESTAAKILELVEHSSEGKAPSENFVKTFAKFYTPVVIGLAAAVALIPSLITGEWSVWISRALSFLVVSCPCALVISVPLSYFGGIGGASRQGILIKGSQYLEALAKANTFIFDKTGTLTEGAFEVLSISGDDPDHILEIAALCEQFSHHPIALSLLRAYGKVPSAERVSDYAEQAGYGCQASVDGEQYFVGNAKWMVAHGLNVPSSEKAGTLVYVADKSRIFGSVTIGDRVRPEAEEALLALRRNGIRTEIMLTGDSESAAAPVAKRLGIDQLHAGLLPGEKAEQVQCILSQKTGNVVFVGDGMNDAPVLAAADVGIAMGAIGSDAAIEAADLVLMHDDLNKLPAALKIARKTHRIVLENILFAIGIKVLVLILCAVGSASMWHAVFADVGVSVLAILNAMRTLRKIR